MSTVLEGSELAFRAWEKTMAGEELTPEEQEAVASPSFCGCTCGNPLDSDPNQTRRIGEQTVNLACWARATGGPIDEEPFRNPKLRIH